MGGKKDARGEKEGEGGVEVAPEESGKIHAHSWERKKGGRIARRTQNQKREGCHLSEGQVTRPWAGKGERKDTPFEEREKNNLSVAGRDDKGGGLDQNRGLGLWGKVSDRNGKTKKKQKKRGTETLERGKIYFKAKKRGRVYEMLEREKKGSSRRCAAGGRKGG